VYLLMQCSALQGWMKTTRLTSGLKRPTSVWSYPELYQQQETLMTALAR
jgi:hypothetical protein